MNAGEKERVCNLKNTMSHSRVSLFPKESFIVIEIKTSFSVIDSVVFTTRHHRNQKQSRYGFYY